MTAPPAAVPALDGLAGLAGLASSPALLWTLEALWVAGVVLWLLHDRRTPAATLAWILSLAFLPGVGIPVYLFLGPRRLRRKTKRRALAKALSGPYRHSLAYASAGATPAHGGLMRLANGLDAPPPASARAVALLDGGDATFDALEAAVRAARDHVHAEYYIFRPDQAGRRLRDALAERARAGVAVRLLVDAAGSTGLTDAFLAPLLRAGGQVARFNGVFGRLGSPRFFNFRTHRKIVVVDGQVGFTGGVNVSDDQSERVRGAAAWRDTHLRLEGNAVHGLQLTFVDDWNSSAARLVALDDEAQRARWFPLGAAGPETVQILASGPDQAVPAIAPFLLAALGQARQRAWLTTPYFVPDEPLLAALCAAARRGVDVRLLLPRRTDSRLVDAAGRTFHEALMAAGVEIHLHGPPMIHAKTALFDDDLAMVGTANLDDRSLKLNFEVAAVVYGGALPGRLADLFEADLRRARRRRRDDPRDRWPRRLFGSLARLLASQL